MLITDLQMYVDSSVIPQDWRQNTYQPRDDAEGFLRTGKGSSPLMACDLLLCSKRTLDWKPLEHILLESRCVAKVG